MQVRSCAHNCIDQLPQRNMTLKPLRICTLLALSFAFNLPAKATSSLFVEDMTWQEVRDAVAGGKTTALYYAGSTEQNGPHMVTGKHNLIARHVVSRIGKELGNALIYPLMPFAPTGDAHKKTGHMAYAGSVTVDDETYASVARHVAWSAAAAGFKCFVLMGDHGGGQTALGRVAQEATKSGTKPEMKVVHVLEVYERSNELAMAHLKQVDLPYGDHASIIDTSELMFVAPASVRMDLLSQANQQTGSSGFAQLATAELGKLFIDYKVSTALSKIREPSACGL